MLTVVGEATRVLPLLSVYVLHFYIIGCGCASGERLPPYILFKGKNLYKAWTEGGPAGALYGVSESGWMEKANFLEWFKKMFLPAIQHLSTQPGVALFVDGHHSHMSLELIELAREKGVHLVCFPPHMTHILQPLDVSVYHPLKQSWAGVLKQYKLESMAENVNKPVFSSLIRKLWECSFKPSHLIAGFRATGLYPVDKAVVQGKLSASIPFCLPSTSVPSSTSSDVSSVSSAGTSASSAPSSSSSAVALQGTLLIKGACSNCGAALTPMRPHLTLHFQNLLQQKNASKTTNNRKRVKSKYYGEALTSDEVFERLQAEEENKRPRQKKRRQSPTVQNEERACSSAAADASDTESHDEGTVYFIQYL